MNSQTPLTIMIVEDNHADVYLLKAALVKADVTFKPVVFGDGESACLYLDRGGDESTSCPLPDAAILDLNVPKRNGSEVLAYIRAHPDVSHIPVVILSSAPTDVMRDRAAQADHYIEKPTDLDVFMAIGGEIRDCVRTVRANGSLKQ